MSCKVTHSLAVIVFSNGIAVRFSSAAAHRDGMLVCVLCMPGFCSQTSKDSLPCHRPATEGSLDPFTPEIGIPEDTPHHQNPADDLPYYFVTILDDDDSSPAQPAQAKVTGSP
jgi:hypothetical protein